MIRLKECMFFFYRRWRFRVFYFFLLVRFIHFLPISCSPHKHTHTHRQNIIMKKKIIRRRWRQCPVDSSDFFFLSLSLAFLLSRAYNFFLFFFFVSIFLLFVYCVDRFWVNFFFHFSHALSGTYIKHNETLTRIKEKEKSPGFFSHHSQTNQPPSLKHLSRLLFGWGSRAWLFSLLDYYHHLCEKEKMQKKTKKKIKVKWNGKKNLILSANIKWFGGGNFFFLFIRSMWLVCVYQLINKIKC